MSKVTLTPEQVQFRQGVVCIVLGVLALAGCAWLVGDSMENLRSGSWPRTQGTIESFRVVQQVKTRSVQYRVETRYSFTVGGAVHHGDRFNTRGNYTARSAASTASEASAEGTASSSTSPGRRTAAPCWCGRPRRSCSWSSRVRSNTFLKDRPRSGLSSRAGYKPARRGGAASR